MLADERRGIVGAALERRQDVGIRRRIAERHSDISPPALEA
jgi:hypothetical protein